MERAFRSACGRGGPHPLCGVFPSWPHLQAHPCLRGGPHGLDALTRTSGRTLDPQVPGAEVAAGPYRALLHAPTGIRLIPGRWTRARHPRPPARIGGVGGPCRKVPFGGGARTPAPISRSFSPPGGNSSGPWGRRPHQRDAGSPMAGVWGGTKLFAKPWSAGGRDEPTEDLAHRVQRVPGRDPRALRDESDVSRPPLPRLRSVGRDTDGRQPHPVHRRRPHLVGADNGERQRGRARRADRPVPAPGSGRVGRGRGRELL